ncbi:hypothetical protein [Falsiroseomonas sp.]|uniref:hypothetical protein n=1 Tax=Falsiroseomonas sp. TaxID=2870721 RepID=UPI00356218B6
MEDLEGLLARLPLSLTAQDDLRARLCAAGRHYRGAAHAALLWQHHRRFAASLWLTSEPWDTRIACAIAFHDAIYDARRRDDEASSTAHLRTAARKVDSETVHWVSGTIEATADHLMAEPDAGIAPQAWKARAWVLDLDLTPLGETADVFAAKPSCAWQRMKRIAARWIPPAMIRTCWCPLRWLVEKEIRIGQRAAGHPLSHGVVGRKLPPQEPELFRSALVNLVDPRHPLALPTRPMVGPHLISKRRLTAAATAA